MSAAAPESAASVVHETLRIAGENPTSDRRFDVRHPYDGQVVGTCVRATPEDAARAFRVAAGYRPTLSRYERQQILLRTAAAIADRREEIANLITAESGLSLKDSLYEAGRAYDVCSLAGQLCIHDDGEVFSCDLTPHGKARKIFTTREPLRGVISAITPFNHPLNMVAHKVAPSVATNNRMVCKPTELTPLTALRLADILYEAGLPPQMFQVITGLPQDIGEAMVTDPHIDLITFTGGVPVGKLIARQAGYRRTVLELGGNDPLIVMEDADPAVAAELAVAGATKNSGQRCTAVKRILAVDGVADALVAEILERARAIRFGDPRDPDTDLGTVIHEQAAELFQRRVEDAVAAGARLLYGNQREGALYSPTVVDHVPPDCELVREETFGPVIPIVRCKDIDDVIRVSNSTEFGLSSGVCSNRLDYITRFISELEVGTVNVWEVPGYRIEMSPFGGIKDSGLGYKEGVQEAMKSFTNVKTFSMPWNG
jgi:putative phosphonoacetaldehyde dehydrogenase